MKKTIHRPIIFLIILIIMNTCEISAGEREVDTCLSHNPLNQCVVDVSHKYLALDTLFLLIHSQISLF